MSSSLNQHILTSRCYNYRITRDNLSFKSDFKNKKYISCRYHVYCISYILRLYLNRTKIDKCISDLVSERDKSEHTLPTTYMW